MTCNLQTDINTNAGDKLTSPNLSVTANSGQGLTQKVGLMNNEKKRRKSLSCFKARLHGNATHTEQLGGRICVAQLTNRWADHLF